MKNIRNKTMIMGNLKFNVLFNMVLNMLSLYILFFIFFFYFLIFKIYNQYGRFPILKFPRKNEVQFSSHINILDFLGYSMNLVLPLTIIIGVYLLFIKGISRGSMLLLLVVILSCGFLFLDPFGSLVWYLD